MDDDANSRTLYCGNISPKITEALLYELFLQMGPLNSVRVPRKDGANRGFAFVEFKHEVAVPYTLALLQGTMLDGRELTLRCNAHKNEGQRQGGFNAGGRDRYGGQFPTPPRNQPMREQCHQSPWQHQQPTREQGWQHQGHHYNQPARQGVDRRHHQEGRDHHRHHRDSPYQRDRRHQDSRDRRW